MSHPTDRLTDDPPRVPDDLPSTADAERAAENEAEASLWARSTGTEVELEHVLRDVLVPLPRVVAMLRDVAGVLDALAARGKAYGAVSPSTILVDASGRAALVPPGEIDGLRAGYLAPEQRHGDAPDARLDQYALGVVAYELLTGERRETHVDGMSHIDAVNDMRLGPEHAFRPGLGPGVNEVIRRAIARDPKWRYPSATVFVEALATQIGAPPPVTRADDDLVDRVATARYARAQKQKGWKSSGMAPASRFLILSTYGVVLVGSLVLLTYVLLSVTGRTTGALGPGQDRRESFLASIGRSLGLGGGGGAAGAAASAAPAAPRGFVSVDVTGIPSASVFIDGQAAGTAPGLLSVTSGLHVVEVRAQGRVFVPPLTTISVSAGDTSRASFQAQ
ncbi:hypothetical protein [Roseisolibacter sp. H3M3-2]|uniref:serine/threonine protein kinase n=1 Tax=Roseisolibacter sp. H3M3-2 TaxID=3031323 RepID=UPI0023DC64E9|nr:hypothetical protein [Roseisolibacter sp. H3M3-2]MDF1501864.1 hypothetical protein [Roseisolibacter sp. H3M3-2]